MCTRAYHVHMCMYDLCIYGLCIYVRRYAFMYYMYVSCAHVCTYIHTMYECKYVCTTYVHMHTSVPGPTYV